LQDLLDLRLTRVAEAKREPDSIDEFFVLLGKGADENVDP
jgi:hypothetical protein